MIGPLLALGGALLGTFAVARTMKRKGEPTSWAAAPGESDFASRVETAIAEESPAQLAELAARAAAAGRQDIAGPLKKEAERIAAKTGKPVPTAPAPAPVPQVQPQLPAPAEAPGLVAARGLTEYLQSIGGLKGRGKEDKGRVRAAQIVMALEPDGLYGRKTALKVAQLGPVPVVPYYWPRTNTERAKRAFAKVIEGYANADQPRASQWAALLRDIERA